MYYESHHTFDLSQERTTAEITLKDIAGNCGGKFSKIDGDPLLGDKIYAYITFHTEDVLSMYYKWNKLEDYCDLEDVFWIRRKIEHVILDERRERESKV